MEVREQVLIKFTIKQAQVKSNYNWLFMYFKTIKYKDTNDVTFYIMTNAWRYFQLSIFQIWKHLICNVYSPILYYKRNHLNNNCFSLLNCMGCNKPISSFFQCILIGISTFQLNKNYPQSTKVEIAKVFCVRLNVWFKF